LRILEEKFKHYGTSRVGNKESKEIQCVIA
jgi:hypothetical protein